jgi:DNA ligase (NAD+)
VPFHRVLFALGIRFVGETTAKYLAEHFRSLEAIQTATREELTEAEEVGEKIADAIIEYFADERNQQIIERLRAAGLQLTAKEREQASDALAGLTFVISGSFANHSRDELKALIEANGGKNLAAVSANTSYLLAGDKIGPAKLQKANKLGIKIISEDEFIAMIGDNDTLPTTTAEVAPTKEVETKEKTSSQNTPQPIQGSLF